MTKKLFEKDLKRLNKFLKNSDQKYILIKTDFSEQRKAIHEWAEKNSCFSRSEYKLEGEKVCSIICSHCHQVGREDEELTGVLIDFYYLCVFCFEFTEWNFYSQNPTQVKFEKYALPTGYMIVMKEFVPNYKKLAPGGGSWKGKKKR